MHGAQKADFSHESGMQTIAKTRDPGNLQHWVQVFRACEPNH
jgi:hypothetical protein